MIAQYPTQVWDGLNTVSRTDKHLVRAPDDNDFDQIVAEIQAIQNPPGNGAAAGTGVVESKHILGQIHVSTLTITNLDITITDATTNGAHGTQKIFDFPAGNILILGAVGALTGLAGAGGITDTAAVVVSVGSAAVATDNATLTLTEADIIPSSAMTLSSGAGSADMANTAQLIKDGTTSAAAAHLNVAIPDAGSTANDTLTINGTITLTWINLGDN